MRVLIDADGCPVVDIAVKEAKQHKIECIILCDTSHLYEKMVQGLLLYLRVLIVWTMH